MIHLVRYDACHIFWTLNVFFFSKFLLWSPQCDDNKNRTNKSKKDEIKNRFHFRSEIKLCKKKMAMNGKKQFFANVAQIKIAVTVWIAFHCLSFGLISVNKHELKVVILRICFSFFSSFSFFGFFLFFSIFLFYFIFDGTQKHI